VSFVVVTCLWGCLRDLIRRLGDLASEVEVHNSSNTVVLFWYGFDRGDAGGIGARGRYGGRKMGGYQNKSVLVRDAFRCLLEEREFVEGR
jgi:hypothetical protein